MRGSKPTKAIGGHGQVITSRWSRVALVETICATAYTDGKTDGVYAAALDDLARRLRISRQTLDKALAAGIGRGWLRLGTGQIELTAAGIYIAKLALKLPT